MITIPGVDAALDDVEVVSETVAVAQYGGRSIDLNVATGGCRSAVPGRAPLLLRFGVSGSEGA